MKGTIRRESLKKKPNPPIIFRYAYQKIQKCQCWFKKIEKKETLKQSQVRTLYIFFPKNKNLIGCGQGVDPPPRLRTCPCPKRLFSSQNIKNCYFFTFFNFLKNTPEYTHIYRQSNFVYYDISFCSSNFYNTIFLVFF